MPRKIEPAFLILSRSAKGLSTQTSRCSGAISLAISINGECIAATTMISTPAAVEEYNNVFSAVFLDVPRGCCYTISVQNLTDEAIEVQNANLIIERVA